MSLLQAGAMSGWPLSSSVARVKKPVTNRRVRLVSNICGEEGPVWKKASPSPWQSAQMVPSELGLLAQAPMRDASHRSSDMQPAHSASRSTGGAASAAASSGGSLAAGATPRSEQAAARTARMVSGRRKVARRMSHLRCGREAGRPAGAAPLPAHGQLVELLEAGELGVAVQVGLVARVEVAGPHAP